MRLLCPWHFPSKDAGVECHFLLQGIFPTQESNPGLLHCNRFFTDWAMRDALMYITSVLISLSSSQSRCSPHLISTHSCLSKILYNHLSMQSDLAESPPPIIFSAHKVANSHGFFYFLSLQDFSLIPGHNYCSQSFYCSFISVKWHIFAKP